MTGKDCLVTGHPLGHPYSPMPFPTVEVLEPIGGAMPKFLGGPKLWSRTVFC